MKKLYDLAPHIPVPSDYFKGLKELDISLVRNILIFRRLTRLDLQQETFNSHLHHRFVLVINLETKGEISLNNVNFELRTKQALLIFPFQFHSFLNLDSESLRWVFITFELPEIDRIEKLRHRILNLNEKQFDLITDIVEEFIAPVPDADHIILQTSLLLHLLKKQAMFSKNENNPKPVETVAARMLQKINRVIISEENGMPQIPKIAQAIHLSEGRLRTLFRQYFNISLGQYLQYYQVNKAVSLMENSDMTLTEIAVESGYHSLATFSRAFKRIMKKNPKSYRSKSKE